MLNESWLFGIWLMLDGFDPLLHTAGILVNSNFNYASFQKPFLLPFDMVCHLTAISCNEIKEVVNMHHGCILPMTEGELIAKILGDANLYYNVTPQEFVSFIFEEMTSDFFIVLDDRIPTFSDYIELRQSFDKKEAAILELINKLQDPSIRMCKI